MRPDPTSSPSTVTSADSAEANGAIRWGAGISSTKSSDAELRGSHLGHGTTKLRRSRRWLDAGLLGCRHVYRLGRPADPGDQTRRLTCEDRPMPAASATDPALHDSAFLRAARSEPTPYTPVWFMRQAGRSLPEYLKVREGVSMLDSCMRPELVVEITMQPVRRYGVDAAIFFSDIVLPLKAVGVDLDIVPGVGPVVAEPVRTLADVEAIPDLTPEHVPFITEAVQGLVGELGATPLIGFAGRAVHRGVVPRRGRAVQGARAAPRR